MPKFIRVGKEFINLDHVLHFVVEEHSVRIVYAITDWTVEYDDTKTTHAQLLDRHITGEEQAALRDWLQSEVYNL